MVITIGYPEEEYSLSSCFDHGHPGSGMWGIFPDYKSFTIIKKQGNRDCIFFTGNEPGIRWLLIQELVRTIFTFLQTQY